MTKDEILAASDEQLNELCATRVMGWKSRTTMRDGITYFFWMNGDYGTEAYLYKPTKNIAQAIQLLDHLKEQGFFNSIYSNVDQPHRVSVGKRGEWGWYNGSCEDESRSRAIVIACLLVLANLEELEASVAGMEQQTAAAGDAAREGAG